MLEFQISTKKELRVTKNRNKERTLLSVEDIVDIKTSKLVEYFYTSLLEPKWWHAGRHDLFGEWENEGFVVSFMHLEYRRGNKEENKKVEESEAQDS